MKQLRKKEDNRFSEKEERNIVVSELRMDQINEGKRTKQQTQFRISYVDGERDEEHKGWKPNGSKSKGYTRQQRKKKGNRNCVTRTDGYGSNKDHISTESKRVNGKDGVIKRNSFGHLPTKPPHIIVQKRKLERIMEGLGQQRTAWN